MCNPSPLLTHDFQWDCDEQQELASQTVGERPGTNRIWNPPTEIVSSMMLIVVNNLSGKVNPVSIVWFFDHLQIEDVGSPLTHYDSRMIRIMS